MIKTRIFKLLWVIALIPFHVWSQDSLKSVQKFTRLSNLENKLHSDSFRLFPNEIAQDFQEKLNQLEVRILLIQEANISGSRVAENAYHLEHDLLSLLYEIIEKEELLNSLEKNFFVNHLITNYKKLRNFQVKQFEEAVSQINQAIPGLGGLQNKIERFNQILYAPNYRQDNFLSVEERELRYEKKLSEAIEKGFKKEQVEIFNPEYLSKLRGFHQFEFTQMADLSIRVTRSTAGHVLIAEGKDVITAGQMTLFVSKKGEVLLAALTNASGNYKPDLSSTHILAHHLRSRFGIPSRSIMISKGEVLSFQTLKLFLRAQGETDDEISMKIKRVKNSLSTRLITNNPWVQTPRCAVKLSVVLKTHI